MEINKILQAHHFQFKNRLGQNFLTDTNLLRAMVHDANVSSQDTVLEIGPGAGTLTAELAAVAHRVIAVEIDRHLSDILAQVLVGCNNVAVHFDDIMKLSTSQIQELTGGQDYRVVANLPYYITTPVVMKFLEQEPHAKSITVMVQKEVAERFTAQPATAAYGSVTVAISAHTRAKITRTVSRNLFCPAPNVDSAIVHMDRCNTVEIADEGLFRQLTRAAFAMRRKTLTNNLLAAFPILKRENIQAMYQELNLDDRARGETLSAEQFAQLSFRLQKYL